MTDTLAVPPGASMTLSVMPVGHSTNMVGLPTALLASPTYNDSPVALHIAGVRETNRGLFSLLEACEDAESAARIFQDYVEVAFGLHETPLPPQAGRRRYRASYLRLLRGWAFDCSTAAGAVLKGWVESRFGLFPTWHREPLRRLLSPAWMHYVEEKMTPRFHNNAIYSQLDLLYEFCQWRLQRFPLASGRHLMLYRGVYRHDLPSAAQTDPRAPLLVHLNNLSSFSNDRRVGEAFGDCLLLARVPLTKILFFNALLPHHMLKGESEFLVIGGAYRVRPIPL
ncbi:NAD+--dinitrogen-reductase ADP-D-ribosyltransferase [Plasticicumulans acidivorans]|uniref:NAD+--dinitrogen-reductase ADP-D-ribosyltransferase n=2 Tax=Plasticicumulans acidivorans TaxID=886464 RepID=A0A317N0X4_9GAMM|nr:NAD+--dinitrogen-reductase ADP-D-ribosyltransferase [Plasticicumulans acidivorans]